MAIPAVLFDSPDDRPGDGAGRPVWVHDLACDGFELEDAAGLSAGVAIGIALPGLPRRAARVEVVSEGRCRCRFAEPLPVAVLPRVLAAAPPEQRGMPSPDAIPEPYVRKWHPAVRIAVLGGTALALWTALLRLV